MKVKTAWLVLPIVGVLFVIGLAMYAMNYFQIETSTTGYTYKEQLFQKDQLGTIDITVSDANWQKILDDPMAEQYVEAAVTINGTTVENVGIRAKGNSSLMSVASSESERYSLKVDFAQYNNTQTYYGLETLNLNNNFSDSTQMKEFVSYELMEQLGIATPAHSYVKVFVNGDYYGLLHAVEEIGEAFAKTNYGNTEGFIFKPEGDGSDLAYVSDDTKNYAGIFDEAKLNAETAKNNSNVVQMMKEINEGDTSSLDVDQIARYFALNTALVNMDSYQGSFKHNYYLREDGEGIFSIVPWDYNMSFGGFTGMGGGRDRGEQGEVPINEAPANEQAPANREVPTDRQIPQNREASASRQAPANAETSPATENGDAAQRANDRGRMGMGGMMGGQELITETNIHFSITEPVSGTTVEARPLLNVILQDDETRALYEGYLEQIATELLTEENILAITEPLENLLLEAVEEDPSKFTTTEQFLEGVRGEKSLAEFAKQRSVSILQQLAGEMEGISAAGTGFGGGMPNFEGGAPNFEEMPNFEGGAPNFEGMPDFEGGAPNFEEMPNFEGGAPNVEGMPNFEGGAPNVEGMPNFEGGPPNFGGQRGADSGEVAVNPMKTIIVIGASFLLCLIAIIWILRVGKQKYKRK